MKLIVLAAGFATRLYPLTLTKPKPLLSVAGKPMMEHVLGRLGGIGDIDDIYVVTNAKFSEQFRAWATTYAAAHPDQQITIVDDGCGEDGSKLGAIGDMHFVLSRHEVADHVLVVAGDNLFSHDLTPFVEYARATPAPVLAVYDVGDLEEIEKYNSIQLDADGRIVFFEEKPTAPISTLTGIALYSYPASSLPLIRQYIEEGHNPDQPGRLVQWMYQRTPFYTWTVPGLWYDIGSVEHLEEANRVFAKITVE